MPAQINCTTCKRTQNAFINPKTEEVFCSVCDSLIPNVSHFTKVQLKTLKQYKEVKKSTFSVKCPKCNKEETPLLLSDEPVCGSCKAPLSNLTPQFKLMLKDKLKRVNQDL